MKLRLLTLITLTCLTFSSCTQDAKINTEAVDSQLENGKKINSAAFVNDVVGTGSQQANQPSVKKSTDVEIKQKDISLKKDAQSQPQPTPLADEAVTELDIIDITFGEGEEAVAGKKLTVNYTGWLANGQKFDSSYDRSVPYMFTYGAGKVIKGWDQGLTGMRVGGKRKLIIPPALGYGEQGNGIIPPNAVLVFEIELLAIE